MFSAEQLKNALRDVVAALTAGIPAIATLAQLYGDLWTQVDLLLRGGETNRNLCTGAKLIGPSSCDQVAFFQISEDFNQIAGSRAGLNVHPFRFIFADTNYERTFQVAGDG